MRSWTHVEEAGTASVTEADVSADLGAGVYLVSFEITNESTTTDITLKWGATGEERSVGYTSDGNSTWTMPIPKNGTWPLTADNKPRVKTAAGTATFRIDAFTHPTP